MNAALNLDYVSIEDYLGGEQDTQIRHEYIGGQVFAMAGASEAHNVLALNFAAALHGHLRGGRCRTFIGDMKVRLLIANEDIFYYPDVMVCCDPRDAAAFYKSFPKLIIEVLSDSTEQVDRREKRMSYTQIETLEEYVLVSQKEVSVTIFRRAADWRPETLTLAEARLRLDSVSLEIPVAQLYEGVRL